MIKLLVILLAFEFVFTTSSNFMLKVENHDDHTFDDLNEQCDARLINLTSSSLNARVGVVHSPNYKRVSIAPNYNAFMDEISHMNKKCKWTLVAPSHQIFVLTLVDYTSKYPNVNCLEDKLSFSVDDDDDENAKISFSLYDSKNTRKFHYENKRLDNCLLDLKPFMSIKINSNKLIIEYESMNSLSFLVSFKLVDKTESNIDNNNQVECNKIDEMKCNASFMDLGNATNDETSRKTVLKQKTCINKDLICNCISLYPISSKNVNLNMQQLNTEKLNFYDNCDYLIETYENYILALKSQAICDYYLNLNTKCRTDRRDTISLTENFDDYLGFEDQNMHQQQLPSLKQPETSQLIKSLDVKKQSDSYNSESYKDNIDPSTQLTPQEKEEYCSNVFRTNEFGWIASTNLYKKSLNYDNDLNCSYHIWTQIYQSIQIRFTYFNLNTNLVDETNPNESLNEDLVNLNAENSLNPKFRSLNRTSKTNRIVDYDYLTIYDGPNENFPVLAHFSAVQNDYMRYFNARTFNSKSNHIYVVFHSQSSKYQPSNGNANNSKLNRQLTGFNFTYQIKGYCIEDQLPCNSLYELNCYSPNQTCNDVWDCHNGADEKGCGSCKSDQYRCRNHIFCYRIEDRCDGDNQCIDKSDELNCDKWFCNSANGTFLCKNGRCVYEQWVCDGTNDCEDGSDEVNCPSSFSSRRVITTAVLGGTLCSLLLVMALGCACKLYTLHTIGYRNNLRLSQSVQSAMSAAASNTTTTSATTPLLVEQTNTSSTGNNENVETPHPQQCVNSNSGTNTEDNHSRINQAFSNILNNFSSVIRRPFLNSPNATTIQQSSNSSSQNSNSLCSNSLVASNNISSTTPTSSTNQQNNGLLVAGELPLPHHLIAPPTYNQTMGLVDEYERRQLAFIEHVRTILSQQQSSNGTGTGAAAVPGSLASTLTGTSGTTNPLTSMPIIPTVTTSSTTVHRVTNSGRRSHHSSSRHHRHHGHRSNSSNITNPANSSNTDSNNPANPMENAANSSSVSSNRTSSRSHRHHHRHHYSQSSSSRHHHHSSNNSSNTLQINFDANRRGLMQMQAADALLAFQSNRQQRTEASNLASLPPAASSSSQFNSTSKPQTSSTNNDASYVSPTTSNTTGTSPANLRDRIAKLIKDIVVHHGDNIQYVQLADQNSLNNSQPNASSANTSLSNQDASISSAYSSPNQQQNRRSTDSNSNGTTMNDEEPLIRP